ncbi:hypothetical protein [Hanstruepera marina]|uniref:hypothetical protein n=1 Tax=Hanstruepera marina TaxID=2873265 RepID=UPI001CA666E2|nr:hypothetical protein [Hanstruepera marina]
MKKKGFLALLIITILSCGVSKYKTELTSETFQDDNCPAFNLEQYSSASIENVYINSLDILPVFYDISLKSSINDSITSEKEALRKQVESVVYNSLKKHNISYIPCSLSDFSQKDIADYKNSIRSTSFSLAHNHFVPEEYYTKAIHKVGKHRFKLAFFFQFFPKNNGESERIYIHTLLYDTEINKNVYYEYLIYENCSVRHLNNFEKVINAVVINFKNRNMTL